MRNANRDDLAAHQTRKSIAIRLESFADELVRLANTTKQSSLAREFSSVADDIKYGEPLTAANLEPFGHYLKDLVDRFEHLATTAEQKDLAASFREFASEIAGHAVKDAFQRPLVNQLADEINKAMTTGSSNGVPFARLSKEGKEEFLSFAIDWTDYVNQGLAIEDDKTYQGIGRIIENALAGKPSEEWMGGPDPPALRLKDLLNRQNDQPARATEKEKDRDFDLER
jgi:hypothetical protein